jgi:hypothetical protein
MKSSFFVIFFCLLYIGTWSQTLVNDNYTELFKKSSLIKIEKKPTLRKNVYDYELLINDSTRKIRTGYWFSDKWRLKSIIILYDTLSQYIVTGEQQLFLITNNINKITSVNILLDKNKKLIAVFEYDNGNLISVIYIDDAKKLNYYRQKFFESN